MPRRWKMRSTRSGACKDEFDQLPAVRSLASTPRLFEAYRRSWDVLAGHNPPSQQTAHTIELTQDVAHDFQRLFR